MASGAATAIKLLVATLAFAGAYVGVEATWNTPAPPPAKSQPQTRTLTLRPSPAAGTAGLPARPARSGVLDVAVTPGASCDHQIVARTLLVNPDPSGTLLYGWRMQRWSTTADAWKTYLTANSGFTGDRRTAEWEARVVANPGWYRVELTTRGGEPIRSERFQVAC